MANSIEQRVLEIKGNFPSSEEWKIEALKDLLHKDYLSSDRSMAVIELFEKVLSISNPIPVMLNSYDLSKSIIDMTLRIARNMAFLT